MQNLIGHGMGGKAHRTDANHCAKTSSHKGKILCGKDQKAYKHQRQRVKVSEKGWDPLQYPTEKQMLQNQ